MKCDSVLMLKRLILKKLIYVILFIITVLMGRIDEQAIDLKEIYIKTQ